MKRVVTLAFALMFCMNTSANAMTLAEIGSNVSTIKAETIKKYSDIKEGDWYLENVAKLNKLGVISGYDDGTFKPNNTITRAQFIKLVVTALGYTDVKLGSSYWASEYIAKANELAILDEQYTSNQEYFNTNITRGEIAQIITQTLKNVKKIHPQFDLNKVKEQIKDFGSISSAYMDGVVNVYGFQIINGYPDGEFKANNNATRAEASAIIIRFLEKSDVQKNTTPISSSNSAGSN